MSERTSISVGSGIRSGKEEYKNKELPRDARIIQLIIESMGVEDYEPRVLNQMLEFIHRYVAEVLTDAKVYAQHAGRDASDLQLEDVRLAIQARVNFSFTQPPAREFMLDLAQQKNLQPLPVINEEFGVLLPPDEFISADDDFQLNLDAAKRKRKREEVEENDGGVAQSSSSS